MLPPELLRPVVAHVPAKDDLAALARVSRAFHSEAERVLYRSVILQHPDDALAAALASRRRALLVHECSVYFAPAPNAARKNAALLTLLARMRNLVALSIRGPLPAPPAKVFAFPFRLRSLCTTEPLSRPLLALLRAQPSLARLTLLHPDPVPGSIPPSALPHAQTLATLTPAPALALLPHRPITHLHILAWGCTPVHFAADVFSRSAGPLRALMAAQGLELAPQDLGLLAMHLPHLAFLGDLTLSDAPAAYLPALAQLPLHTLLINRASPGLPARFSEPALVRTLGRACKPLRRVVLTQRVTATYVWARVGASEEWEMCPVEDPCEIAADLWRAA